MAGSAPGVAPAMMPVMWVPWPLVSRYWASGMSASKERVDHGDNLVSAAERGDGGDTGVDDRNVDTFAGDAVLPQLPGADLIDNVVHGAEFGGRVIAVGGDGLDRGQIGHDEVSGCELRRHRWHRRRRGRRGRGVGDREGGRLGIGCGLALPATSGGAGGRRGQRGQHGDGQEHGEGHPPGCVFSTCAHRSLVDRSFVASHDHPWPVHVAAGPCGAAPCGAGPCGAAPCGAGPCGAGPCGAAPCGAAPCGAAPCAAGPGRTGPCANRTRSHRSGRPMPVPGPAAVSNLCSEPSMSSSTSACGRCDTLAVAVLAVGQVHQRFG